MFYSVLMLMALAGELALEEFRTFQAFAQPHYDAYDRGQTNLVGLFIGLMIAAIVAIQVFIPVVNDAIASSNVTGTEATILGLLPLFAALLLLIALASPLMRRI
ncbi:hypothetical protein [Haloferax sp. KTX1]|uniref:hypothetical protein n=1 Tax=Haloferax sp. KTX1 TaxID=2600597 RepID=UPI0011DCC4E2|nr:hypothetical protein [Haloferax sp. KTX1]